MNKKTPAKTTAAKGAATKTPARKKAPASKPAPSKAEGHALKAASKASAVQDDTLDVPVGVDIAPAAATRAAKAPKPTKAEAAKALREQVLEDVLEALSSRLRVSVEDGDFTDPNRRTLKLLLGKKCISQTSFDVRGRREYEG